MLLPNNHCSKVRRGRADTSLMDERHTDSAVFLWTLQEVADAAREIPLEQQPERLRRALERVFVARPIASPGYDAGTSSCST
jgi:hypothetical protein